MAQSNIILITNYNSVVQSLKTKLVLLREIDNILTATYANALETLDEYVPRIILLHCDEEKEDCLRLIRAIRANEQTQKAIVVLIVNEYDQEFILNAYDENITDYITFQASDAEILIRIMWCLKNKILSNAFYEQRRLLEELGVINTETGFYTSEYCEKIIENEIKNSKKLDSEDVLMLIAPSEESKLELKPEYLASAIRNSTRESDIITHSNANRFYILLKDTPLKGAYSVFEKVKQFLGKEYTLHAGVGVIAQQTFAQLKERLLNALVEAMSTKQDVVVISEEQTPSEDWLETINASQKNFKLFKQTFNRKLDKVITPVFFQMQKIYEEKLFKTKIEQASTPSLSTFVLKKDNNVSELRVTYPGFSKINIDTIHQGLDSPENKRISLDLAELSEEKLTDILEDFIKEFKGNET